MKTVTNINEKEQIIVFTFLLIGIIIFDIIVYGITTNI